RLPIQIHWMPPGRRCRELGSVGRLAPTTVPQCTSTEAMGGVDSLSAARSSCRPVPGSPEGASHTTPKSQRTRSVSKLARLAFHEFLARLIDEPLELAGFEVGGDLLIPELVIELKKPVAKLG